MTMLDVSAEEVPSASAALPAHLAALYALAALQTKLAAEPAKFLAGAAEVVARGSGCAYGAITIGDGPTAQIFAAGGPADRLAGLAGLGWDAPADRVTAEKRSVISPPTGELRWAAVPITRCGQTVGALVVAEPLEAADSIDLEFLDAVAAFLASAAFALACPPLPAPARDDVIAHADVGALLESMSDPVALIGIDGKLRSANAAYRALLSDAGLAEGPLSAAPGIIMPRDHFGKPVKESERALKVAFSGRSLRAERVLRMADGRDRVFVLSTSPVRDDDGSIEGAAVVMREITAQVARERALRLLEEVRRGLSLSGDLRRAARSVCRRAVALLSWVNMASVYALDGDELMLQAQAGFPERAARMLPTVVMGPAHRTTAALRENQATIFHTDRDEPASEASRRVITASGAATFINLPLVAATHRFGLLVLASREPHTPQRDELALLEAMAAQVGVELEGVRRREEAETERARLQAVLDQLPEGVLLFDAGGRLVMSNRSAEEILGQAVDPGTQVRGLAAHYGFHHPDGRPYQPGDEPVAHTFSTGRPVLGEEQVVRRPDGRDLPVVSNVAPVRDPKGQLAAVIIVFQDITSLREMDRLKDDFLSIAGHELRTPIATIRGLAQLVERRRDRLDPSTVNAALATITEQTEQMGRLVDELLDVSRIRTGRLSLTFAPLDLVNLLRSVVERAQTPRPGPITLYLPEALPIDADAGRLQQVFANLLDNAAKYSDPRTPIEVTANRADGQLVVRVIDHGVGVPPEAIDRLFERFYRAENAAQHAGGLGLGLYLCREIVERHGGRIGVVSSLGDGATFTVRLPLSRGTASGG